MIPVAVLAYVGVTIWAYHAASKEMFALLLVLGVAGAITALIVSLSAADDHFKVQRARRLAELAADEEARRNAALAKAIVDEQERRRPPKPPMTG